MCLRCHSNAPSGSPPPSAFAAEPAPPSVFAVPPSVGTPLGLPSSTPTVQPRLERSCACARPHTGCASHVRVRLHRRGAGAARVVSPPTSAALHRPPFPRTRECAPAHEHTHARPGTHPLRPRCRVPHRMRPRTRTWCVTARPAARDRTRSCGENTTRRWRSSCGGAPPPPQAAARLPSHRPAPREKPSCVSGFRFHIAGEQWYL